MEEIQEKFKSLFTKELIKDIKFYNIKEDFLTFEPEHQWIIQGGLEFIFESHIISLGWNYEMQLNEMIEGDLDEILGELDVYELELDTHPNVEKLKGKKIENVTFKWTWYQKMNDDLEVTDEKVYIPEEILINFEGGNSLQIATVTFQIRDKKMYNPVYEPQSTILISVDQKVEIMDAE